MRNALAIIAGLIGVVSTLPYIRDTLRGKTHPNIVTWFSWSLISAISTVATLAGGATQTAIFTGAFTLCTSFVVIAGLRHGIKHYTPFDVICQILAIVGIIIWRITNDPAAAILINIIANLIATLPTYRHGWLAPREETWQAYAIGALAITVGIISIEKLNFVSLGYPLYIFLSDISLVWMILYRRRTIRMLTPEPAGKS